MTFRPCSFVWDEKAEVMRLEPRFRKVARAQYVDGEEYPLEVIEHRSSKDHAHYFASVRNAFDNINDPETLEVLSTPNKLRQWALIQSGWCEVTVFGPLSKRSAIKSAQTAAINFRKNDDYVEVSVRKTIDDETGREAWLVVIKTAKSQSRAAMKKEVFRESKVAVLDILSGAIEVKRRNLEQAGRESAP